MKKTLKSLLLGLALSLSAAAVAGMTWQYGPWYSNPYQYEVGTLNGCSWDFVSATGGGGMGGSWSSYTFVRIGACPYNNMYVQHFNNDPYATIVFQ